MGGEMNKKLIYLGIVILIIGFLIGSLFIFLEKKYLSEISENLIVIVEEKSVIINDLLFQMENDVGLIAEDDRIKDLLKEELVFEESLIEADVGQRAMIISREVENYLRAFPEMTLEELQMSSEFQEIAVQDIGNKGYSAAAGVEDLIIYFHKNSAIAGVSLLGSQKEFPELLDILEGIRGGENVTGGFYDWRDVDGEIRRKYGKFVSLSVKTADGVDLLVAATSYVDDYKIIGESSDEVDKYLRSFMESFDYYNLVLISPDGYISYMVEPEIGFGTNLRWEVNIDRGLSQNYFNAEERRDVSFYGPYIGDYGDIYPKVSVVIPVYEFSDQENLRADGENNLLGYVGLIDEMDKIFDATEKIIGLSETRESYLINKDELLLSPLRSRDFDIMIQSVDTENSDQCFNETVSGHFEKKELVGFFLNYRGEEVIGAHREIEHIDWCLLSEISKEEVLDISTRDNFRRSLYIMLPSILILTFVGFFVGGYLDKKRGGKK